MRGRGRDLVLAAALAAALLIVTAPCATAETSLVFTASELRALGFRPTGINVAAARRDLGVGLPRGTLVEASAGRRGHVRVAFDAFALPSVAAGRQVLAAWRRRHHAPAVRLGSAGAISAGRSRAAVLWLDHARLGLALVTAPRAARDDAIAFAQTARSALNRRLPTTAWGRVLDQIRPDGTVSERTALAAFSLAYGRLPGVPVPPGGRSVIASGTLAAQWILNYRSLLTAKQRSVVERLLGVRTTGSPRRAHISTFGDDNFRPDTGVQAIAAHWATVEGDKLGLPLGLTLVAGKTSTPVDAYGDAQPQNAAGAYGSGIPVTCRVRLPPAGQATSAEFQRLVIAHEVFHCFEFQLMGSGVWTPLPAWIGEGLADWAALTVDPVSYSVGGGNVTTYLLSPELPLFSRSYDGVGFWGHVQDTYGNLWGRIPGIVTLPSNTSAFQLAGGGSDAFLSSWGSSVFHLSAGPAEWRMVSPILPPSSVGGGITGIEVTDFPTPVFAASYSTNQYVLNGNPDVPLVHVAINGPARLSVKQNYTDLADAWFCIKAGGCKCPKGKTGKPPQSRPLGPQSALGISGGPDRGTEGTIVGHSLDEYCKPKKPKPGPGNAGTYGDPHLHDFALTNNDFDFQGAGEFTLLKSTRDNFEIQVRQQPWPERALDPTLHATVAATSAAAVRLGRSTVEFDATVNHGQATIVLYVNRRRDHALSTALPGGGRVQQLDAQTALLTWKGVTVNVWDESTLAGLSLDIRLPRSRLGHVTGLLGNWGVDDAAEFTGRDGHHYSQTAIVGDGGSVPPNFNALYHQFGASWRIAQRASLFRYPRGKSTRSYTIKNFPRRLLTASMLPADRQAGGQAACTSAGITNARVLDSCVLDVGVTGNTGFGQADRRFQKLGGLPATQPPALHPVDLGVGSDQPQVTHEPGTGNTYVAWSDDGVSSIELCVFATSVPACNGGAGPYRLVDPLANAGVPAPDYFHPQIVIQPGGEVVVMAEVYGGNSSAGFGGRGVAAWASPAGGAAFASGNQGLAAGGQLLAPSGGDGDIPSGGAIAFGGVIGVYGDSVGNGFTDFSLGAAAPPSAAVVDSTGTYVSQVGADSSQIGWTTDPATPGQYLVVVAGGADSIPPGCPPGTHTATGYGVGVGDPAALATQSAWSSSYFTPLSCQASSPVVTGSGGTVGLLDTEGPGLTGAGSAGVYFRRFDASARTFGPAVLVSDETHRGASALSVSEDASGGVYAAWLDSRGIVVAYSADGGVTWGPARTTGLGAVSNALITGVGGGNALLTYSTSGAGGAAHQYVAPVDYQQLP